MQHAFELFLTKDRNALKVCIGELKRQFPGATIERFYPNGTGQFARFYEMRWESDENVWDIAERISLVPGVEEVDPIKLILGRFNTPQWGAYDSDEDYPDDPRWNHTITNFKPALDKAIADGRIGKTVPKVKIGQLDTGYTKHPELSAIINKGYNFVERNNDPLDPLEDGLLYNPGHGTSTSGVIIGAGTGRGNDKNDGVFPHVDFVPYRIANSVVHILPSNIGEAVQKAVDDGCQVITMSMGGAPPRRSWLEAVRYAYENGVIFCCAAGNNVKFVVWPARYTNTIAVAGINVAGKPWEGTCAGEAVDISAPGENVMVPITEKGSRNQKYLYSYGCGTSFATPHVAAAAGLWLTYFRKEIAAANLQKKRLVDAFAFALATSAQRPPNWDHKNYGAGIVDALKLLEQSPDKFMASPLREVSFSARPQPAEQAPNVRQKEMWDLLLNNDAESEPELQKHIDKNGSNKGKNNFKRIQKGVNNTRNPFAIAGPAKGKTGYKAKLKSYSDAVNAFVQ